MADADDATSALIAQMLAADYAAAQGGGGGGYGDSDDGGDDDFGRRKKKKKRQPTKRKPPAKSKAAPKKARGLQAGAPGAGGSSSGGGAAAGVVPEGGSAAAAAAPVAAVAAAAAAAGDGATAAKPKRVIRRWTPEEEVLFVEALSLFGRDWASCAKHLHGSRDVNNFKSHAQKHFIRLYRDGLPLPDKVKESGEGFTLSGKPLDPNSAAARAYGALKTPTNGQALTEEQLENRARNDQLLAEQAASGVVSRQKVVAVDPHATEQQRAEAAARKAAKEAAKAAAKAKAAEQKQAKARQRELASARKLRQRQQAAAESDAKLYGADGRTEYSRRRGRRAAASSFRSNLTDSFNFVECRCYHGGGELAGSGLAHAQPFRVTISPAASTIADLHAHMTHREVIGYLAGRFDQKARTIHIHAAYPGRSISNDSNAFQEAEMDPVHEVELRARIEGDGHTIVGWYHSHPTFQPVPSAVDVNNQRNYQHLFRRSARESSPFVGLIVSPYNLVLPTAQSEFQWFYIEGTATDPEAMTVAASLGALAGPADWDDAELRAQATGVLATYADHYLGVRVGFSDVWRDLGAGRPVTNIDKILGSLRLRLQAAADSAEAAAAVTAAAATAGGKAAPSASSTASSTSGGAGGSGGGGGGGADTAPSTEQGAKDGGEPHGGGGGAAATAAAAGAATMMNKVEEFLKWLRLQCVAAIDIPESPAASPAKIQPADRSCT